MARNYKRKLGSRRYGYTDANLQNALKDVLEAKMSLRQAAQKHNISYGTLHNKIHGKHERKVGGQTAMSCIEEKAIIKGVTTCADWGYPLDLMMLRMFVKSYLDEKGVHVNKFKNNMPGEEWARSLLKRHKNEIGQRMASNISINRSEVSHEIIKEYFENIKDHVKDIPPANIFNYDETAVCDDPGKKKCLFRRGVKYPERISNHSKSSTTIMMCGSALGSLLPPYIIYKAEHMWNTWKQNGPKGFPCCNEPCCSKGSRYNRSNSGWIDMTLFSDWFETVFLPHAKRLDGPKVLLGDNLSSHFSPSVLKVCKENNIIFTCMPPNSSNLCQPLDVGFFRPFKEAWRQVLANYKFVGTAKKTIPKEVFPGLLAKSLITMDRKQIENGAACAINKNLKSAFEACGLFPYSPSRVLNRLPREDTGTPEEVENEVNTSLTNFLKRQRFGDEDKRQERRRKKTKLKVVAGRSVSCDTSDEEEENVDDVLPQNDIEDTNFHDDEEIIAETPMCQVPPSEIAIGSFVLVKFLGGNRKKTEFKYACIVQDVLPEKMYQIVSLRSLNSKKEFKVVENDICHVPHADIIALLPMPEVVCTGERTKYTFPITIDAKEY